MTRFTVHEGGLGQSQRRDGDNRGGGGGNGGEMDINERITGVELAQVQIGMDMQFIRGKIEDMPTKDWVNTRLLTYAAGVSAVIVACATILGYLITSGFSAMSMMVGG